jgi:hypothetical protein
VLSSCYRRLHAAARGASESPAGSAASARRVSAGGRRAKPVRAVAPRARPSLRLHPSPYFSLCISLYLRLAPYPLMSLSLSCHARPLDRLIAVVDACMPRRARARTHTHTHTMHTVAWCVHASAPLTDPATDSLAAAARGRPPPARSRRPIGCSVPDRRFLFVVNIIPRWNVATRRLSRLRNVSLGEKCSAEVSHSP